MTKTLIYPGSSKFAFTILDDTDDTTTINGAPVYEFLHDLGLITTKTVWALDTPPENQGPYFAGETLASPAYLKWVHKLAQQGFEIAFHNATMGSSSREDTIKALDLIEDKLGQKIKLHCNHGQNKENLHWGSQRYCSKILQKIFSFAETYKKYPRFEGNVSNSPYYWADIADKRISYIRAFTYQQLNGEKIRPGRPYLQTSKQKNSLFFNTTDAPNVAAFNKLINPSTINALQQQHGWCIVSTHLGKGFFKNNKLDAEFKENMEYLASLPGWFVPTSQLLDFLNEQRGHAELSIMTRTLMEYAHVIDRIKSRISN